MAPALNAEVIRAPTGPVLSEGAQQPSISETIVHLAEDPIPNIRFNVAKALEVLATVVGPQPGGQEVVKDALVPAIRKLKDDSDADVRYFAGKALEVSSRYAKERPGFVPLIAEYARASPDRKPDCRRSHSGQQDKHGRPGND
jgi:serine/threonine-protein phosphatase 2A regulatory subunit A